MGFTWEEAEVAALNRHGWCRSVGQCVQFGYGINQGQVSLDCGVRSLLTPTTQIYTKGNATEFLPKVTHAS